MLAQLIYGFRLSVLFALALTVIGVVIGVITGAIQGFFAGKTDLAFQRFIEIWDSMPELYLLIIFSAIFAPSVALLLILLSPVRLDGSVALRARRVPAQPADGLRARGEGAGRRQRPDHVEAHPAEQHDAGDHLPAVPHERAILALTSLDFLGLGVPPGTPSLGELLSQGKNNIDAWWISLSTFAVLVITLLLLTFMGDALRDALDPRKADK
jgi:microcin C transport system permease protein